MDAKLIFTFLIVITAFYFRFGAGSRLLKKKSAHYIVPSSSHKDPNWIPIEMSEYSKHVFFKQESDLETIDELKSIIYKRIPKVTADYALLNGWFTINIIQSNFEDYHFLVALCSYINEKNTLGFCKHKVNDEQDYIVKLDYIEGMDNLIGSFRTNQNFGIYLPKSGQNPKGNISRSAAREIDFQQELSRIPSVNFIPQDLIELN